MVNTGKITVTGASGFLGRNLCRLLRESGHSVVAIARTEDFRSEELRSMGCCVILGGPHDAAVVAAIENCESLVHLASLADPRSGIPENDRMALLSLTERAREKHRKVIVYASSGGLVYGRPGMVPTPETHSCSPEGEYARLKLQDEKLLLEAQDIGTRVVLLRVANCYGPLQRYDGKQGIIGTVLYRLMKGIPIEIWGDGNQFKDYVYVLDVTRAMVQSIAGTASGVFNIGSSVATSLREVVRICERVTGREAVLEFRSAKSTDNPISLLDCRKAGRDLGWQARVDLETGVEETWKWIQLAR